MPTHIANVYPVLESIVSYLHGVDLKNFNMASRHLHFASRSKHFGSLVLRNCPFPPTLYPSVRQLVVDADLFPVVSNGTNRARISICQEIKAQLPTLDGTIQEIKFFDNPIGELIDFVLTSLPNTPKIIIRHATCSFRLAAMTKQLKNVHEAIFDCKIVTVVPRVMATLTSFKTLTSLTILDRCGRFSIRSFVSYEAEDVVLPRLRRLAVQSARGSHRIRNRCPGRALLSVAPALTELELWPKGPAEDFDRRECRAIVLKADEDVNVRIARLVEFLRDPEDDQMI